MKTTQHVKLEEVLLTWFKGVRLAGVYIDGTILRKKAEDIVLQLGIGDFRASGERLHRF